METTNSLFIPFIVVMACAIIQSIMAVYYCKKADKYKKMLKRYSLNNELPNLIAPTNPNPAENTLRATSKGEGNRSKAGNKKCSPKL